MGGMAGMMGGGRAPNLKKLDPDDQVRAISYCKDTYTVTTANGQTRKFWGGICASRPMRAAMVLKRTPRRL
jgi:hypothetical protein